VVLLYTHQHEPRAGNSRVTNEANPRVMHRERVAKATRSFFLRRKEPMEKSEQPTSIVCRGVRGATVAEENTRDAIHAAVRELVAALVEANGIDVDDLASAIFTTTPDLDAAFPSEAARLMGWDSVPLLGAVEMNKPGAQQRCIRVLLHWNTAKKQGEIKHIYLRGTDKLRQSSD
jgi:chorismate mutase